MRHNGLWDPPPSRTLPKTVDAQVPPPSPTDAKPRPATPLQPPPNKPEHTVEQTAVQTGSKPGSKPGSKTSAPGPNRGHPNRGQRPLPPIFQLNPNLPSSPSAASNQTQRSVPPTTQPYSAEASTLRFPSHLQPTRTPTRGRRATPDRPQSQRSLNQHLSFSSTV